MTHTLIAICFGAICAAIGLRSPDRPAGTWTAGAVVTTSLAVIALAAAGFSK